MRKPEGLPGILLIIHRLTSVEDDFVHLLMWHQHLDTELYRFSGLCQAKSPK